MPPAVPEILLTIALSSRPPLCSLPAYRPGLRSRLDPDHHITPLCQWHAGQRACRECVPEKLYGAADEWREGYCDDCI